MQRRAWLPLLRHGVRRFSASTSEAMAEHPDATGRSRIRPSAIILFLPCAVTFGLGTWQLMRREWKRDLLDRKRSMLAEEPVPLGEALLTLDESDAEAESIESFLEYRRVICEGVYDESKSIFIGPRMKKLDNASQRGYLLVTPLYPCKDSASFLQPPVLVNRGWVPHSWKEEFEKGLVAPDAPPPKDVAPLKYNKGAWWKLWWRRPSSVQDDVSKPAEATGVVRVCGVVRGSEDPNMFVPLNSPETGQWFYIDVPLMAKAAGLPEVTPYVEAIGGAAKAEQELIFPIPKEPEDFLRHSLMPSDHLNYALTWYTLSAATTFMAIKRIKQKPARRNYPINK